MDPREAQVRMVVRVQLALPVPEVCQGLWVCLVQKDSVETQGRLERQDHLEYLAREESTERTARRGRQGHLDRPALQEREVNRGHLD